MSVRKLGALDADIITLLPDNTERLIVPARVRGLMQDIRESLAETWGLLDCTANTHTLNLSTTPITLTGVWTGKVQDAGMGADQTAGTVTGYSVGGWNHIFQFIASMVGPTGTEVTLQLRVNGTDTLVIGTTQLRGNSAPQILQVESFREAAPAGAVYQIMIKADRAATVLMPRGYMRIMRRPTA